MVWRLIRGTVDQESWNHKTSQDKVLSFAVLHCSNGRLCAPRYIGLEPCIPSASQRQSHRKNQQSQASLGAVGTKECPFASELPWHGEYRSQGCPRTPAACGAPAGPTPTDAGLLAGSADGLLGQLQLAGRHRSLRPGRKKHWSGKDRNPWKYGCWYVVMMIIYDYY